MKPIDAFYDMPTPTPQQAPMYGNNGVLDNLSAFNVGVGNTGLYVDKLGIRLGGATMAAAPFSVDMQGNITANKFKAVSIVLSNNGIPQIVIGTF